MGILPESSFLLQHMLNSSFLFRQVLPFMSLTFPTLWDFSFLWPLSSFFCCFACLFPFSEILIYLLWPFFSCMIFSHFLTLFLPFFTVVVRTFLFRKLIMLVLPTLLLFCSCLILCSIFFIAFFEQASSLSSHFSGTFFQFLLLPSLSFFFFSLF